MLPVLHQYFNGYVGYWFANLGKTADCNGTKRIISSV